MSMKRHVQNIERLFAGQTANALVLSQVDEDFPELTSSLVGDERMTVRDWMREVRKAHPTFNPCDWAYEVRFVADNGSGKVERLSRTRAYLAGMDVNMPIYLTSESVIPFPYQSLEDGLRGVYAPGQILTSTTILDLLNAYVVEHNLILQQRFKSRAHDELYMMDDTAGVRPSEHSYDVDKRHMHCLNGKMTVGDAVLNASQLNVLFPWRKTTSKSLYAAQVKPRQSSDMDDLLERDSRGITLQGRVSSRKCLQAVAQTGNSIYMLSPSISIADKYICSNSQTIMNAFDAQGFDGMNPLPNGLTLFQPGWEDEDGEGLKDAVAEFREWHEMRNHRALLHLNDDYGSNVTKMRILGPGSYEMGLATYGISSLVLSSRAAESRNLLIPLNEDTFRQIREGSLGEGKYVSGGTFSIGDRDMTIGGFRLDLLDGFMTGQDRVLQIDVPEDKDFNHLVLKFQCSLNNAMPDQVEFYVHASLEGDECVERTAFDLVLDGHASEQNDVSLSVANAVLQRSVLKIVVRMHYSVDFNRRQNDAQYREWLKGTWVQIGGLAVENDASATVSDSKAPNGLTFGSYVNEDGISNREHLRRLAQFWQVWKYKNDISYQSVLETSVKNTTSSGMRNLNNYSSGDIYGDMFLTKSLLDPLYDMHVETAHFNEKEGAFSPQQSEDTVDVLKFDVRNYINLLQCSNQLALVYSQASAVVGDDQAGMTFGGVVPWHDWTESDNRFQVSVVWDSRGGDYQQVWMVKRGSTLKESGRALPYPRRMGYDFFGWWTTPRDDYVADITSRMLNDGTYEEGERVDENTYVLDSVTFYARWHRRQSSDQSDSSQLARGYEAKAGVADEVDQEVVPPTQGISHVMADAEDDRFARLKYQMVETVRNINRFESSIKHKPNVFSVVVENSNLAEDPYEGADQKLEDYKARLRDSVGQFVRNACREIAPAHTQLFDVQFT